MITTLRRRLGINTSANGSSESGITLVELLVAMIVLGILSAIVISLYNVSNKSVISTSSSDQNTQAAGNIMAEVDRVIRGATTNPTPNGNEAAAIISGTPTTLSLFSYVDSSAITTTPTYVQFTINSTNGQLVEKRWAAGTDSNGLFTFDITKTPSLTRTFPGKIVLNTAPYTSTNPALFSYVDQSGPPPAAIADPLPLGIASGDLDNVAAVVVNLNVQTSKYPNIDPATIVNTVGMPNVTLEDNNS